MYGTRNQIRRRLILNIPRYELRDVLGDYKPMTYQELKALVIERWDDAIAERVLKVYMKLIERAKS